jgi:hypothetical protein
MKTKDPNFEETYRLCKEFKFDESTTAEMCWNVAYQLGRKRWHWGPHWAVTLNGWKNAQVWRLKRLFGIEPK